LTERVYKMLAQCASSPVRSVSFINIIGSSLIAYAAKPGYENAEGSECVKIKLIASADKFDSEVIRACADVGTF